MQTFEIGDDFNRLRDFVKMISNVSKISTEAIKLKKYLETEWKNGKTGKFYL